MDVDTHYLKVGDVAGRLALDESTVYKMVRDRELPSVRLGRKAVRIPAAGLEAYLRRHEVNEVGAASRGALEVEVPQERLLQLIDERAERFTGTVGFDPHSFCKAWQQRELEDTPENADLAIEAFALASALDRAGKTGKVFA